MLLPKLKGEKINLRRHKRSDAQSIYENIKDEEIARYTFIPHPYSITEAYKFIKKCHSDLRSKREFNFGIEDKENGKIIGGIGLSSANLNFRHAEIGYWVAKRFWGKGIGKEALNLGIKFGFEQLGLNRIYARVMHPNKVSAYLLESVGFVREGVMREALRHENEWWDYLWYSMLLDEYKALT
jgi:RimJ/RimL family protein N-acetyltransferase